MTGTQIVPGERAHRAPGRRGERRQPASLPARHPGRRRRRARAAGRRPRDPLDQDHLEGLGARPHHRAHRPDHPRGRGHARQGALARRQGGHARRRPTRAARASPRSACTATWCRTRCRRSARPTATRTRARSPSPRSPPRSRAAARRGRSSSRTRPTPSPRVPTRSTWSSTAGRSWPGRYGQVYDEIVAVKEACRRADGTYAHLKVILETGELNTYDNVRRASLAGDPGRRRLHQDVHRQGRPRGHAAGHPADAGGRARLAPPQRREGRRQAGRRHPRLEGRDQVPGDGRRDGRGGVAARRTCSGSAPRACSTTCCCSARR